MSKAIPEIIRAISSLNRTDLNYKRRAALVELFDSTYKVVHDFYRPKIKNSSKGSFKNEDCLERFRQLTREMSFAHKIIVNDCQNKSQLWGKNKIKIRSIAFSIFYLGIMLMEQYEKYSPIPIYLWREINSLFAYAGKDEIEDIEVPVKNTYCLSSIEQNYIRNCLIALSDPYRLDSSHHWHVFHYLHNCCKLAKISEDPDDFEQEACFIIDVTSENKPSFVTQELDDPEDPKIRLLLTKKLLKRIAYDEEDYRETKQLPSDGFHPSITLETAKILWKHLAKQWKSRIERSARRYPVVTKVDVVWGIENVNTILNQVQKNCTKSLTHDEVCDLTHMDKKDHLTWEVNNVSSDGIGLNSRHYILPHIRIGDVVLIREYMDGKPANHWRLAISRWHTGDKHTGTMLGLSYVDGQYHPVRLITHKGKNENGGQFGVVVSRADVNGNQSQTIISSQGSAKPNLVYAMIGLDQAVEIRPRAQLEETAYIDHFCYQVYELREELAKEVENEIVDIIPWTTVPSESNQSGSGISIDDGSLSIDDYELPDDL
jgi:hypothetical protein